MPWIARYNGSVCGAWEVPFQTDAECVECGERVRIWRDGGNGGRHFKHVGNMGQGSGGGGAACESVAESNLHIKWKNLAAERLANEFSDNLKECTVEKELAAPTSDKQRRVGDAVLTFEERDVELGDGIVVEVQHRNHGKNIQETTRDYIDQDHSVVWTTEDDYDVDRCRLAEVDFRARAKDSVWPEFVPDTSSWAQNRVTYPEIQGGWRATLQSGLGVSGAEAILPPDWFDEEARRIWESQDWDGLFSPPEDFLDFWDFSEVPASIPRHWYLPTTLEYWRSEDWDARFRGGPGPADRPTDGTWEHTTPLSFGKWLRDSDGGPYRYELEQAYYDGISSRDGEIRFECEYCDYSEWIGAIHPAEKLRSRKCRDCGKWNIVVDRRGQSGEVV